MLESAYFAVGVVAYGFFERRERRFVSLSLAAALVFLALSTPILSIPHVMLRGGVLGGSLWLTTLLVRLLAPQSSAGTTAQATEKVVPIGIIDFSWTGIMSGALAFVTFANSSEPFHPRSLNVGAKPEYHQAVAEFSQFLLDATINGFFALGATLAACMAILWAGEQWRKSGEAHEYKSTTLAAIKMVFAFFWVAFGIFVWIGWPLYSRIVEATDALK